MTKYKEGFELTNELVKILDKRGGVPYVAGYLQSFLPDVAAHGIDALRRRVEYLKNEEYTEL